MTFVLFVVADMVKTNPLEAVHKTRKGEVVGERAATALVVDGKRGGGGGMRGRGGRGLLASAIAVALGGEIHVSEEKSAALVTDLGASADSIEQELADSIRKARERRSRRLLGKSKLARQGITAAGTITTKKLQVVDCSRNRGVNDIGDDGIAIVGALAVKVAEREKNVDDIDGIDEMEMDIQPPSRHSTRGGVDQVGSSGQLPSPSSSATSSFVRCSGNVVVFDESGRALVESVDYFSAQNLVEGDCAL